MSKSSFLFHTRKLNDISLTSKLFMQAMKENCQFHYNHCLDYKNILDKQGFLPSDLKTEEDLAKLPFIPTAFLKLHPLMSLPNKKLLIKATSSGTSGHKTVIGLDLAAIFYGIPMIYKALRKVKLISLQPRHFIIFGYQPSKDNKSSIARTSKALTFLSPAVSKTYALKYHKGSYNLDLENIKQTLIKKSHAHFPTITIGFPAYTYFLLKQMKEEGIFLKMPKGSKLTIGGGWKQFYQERIDKTEFYRLVKEVLDIDDHNCIEFFSAMEHPVLYVDCRYHHFHLVPYARAIIRDVETFAPLGYNKPGLLNLLTPMLKSHPLLSIMTDDLAILHDEPCLCGCKSPYLEILGRVGVEDIKTCAQTADSYLKVESGL
jgi:phenylacetate-coenzyme A ligase PaaK-like adenylate-forming protein